MNRWMFCLSIMLIGVFAGQVTVAQQESMATDLLVIRGNVRNSDGSLAANGLIVEVANLSKELSQFDVTGAVAGPGAYAVTFFGMNAAEGTSPVAEVGDKWQISVRPQNSREILGSAEFILGEDAIQAHIVQRDLVLSGEAPPPTPGDAYLFVVRGIRGDCPGSGQAGGRPG